MSSRRARMIGYLVGTAVIAVAVLYRSKLMSTQVAYGVLSFGVGCAVCLVFLALYGRMVRVTNRPRASRLMVCLILAISMFAAYQAFTRMMLVDVCLVYDATTGKAYVILDGNVAVLDQAKTDGNRSSGGPMEIGESFSYSDRVGSAYCWHRDRQFRVDGLGLGMVCVRALGHEVLFRKHKELIIDGTSRKMSDGWQSSAQPLVTVELRVPVGSTGRE